MANPSRRGQVAGPVSGQMRGDEETPFANTSAILPYGLRLQQTILAGTTSVTIPDGVTFVYAIAVGGGGAGTYFGNAGGAGGVAWGWTIATSSCIVGAGATGTVAATGTSGGYTRYGNIIAGGGASAPATPFLGGGGSTQNGVTSGSTNYWGIPGGANATTGVPRVGSGASGAQDSGPGGNGISGGGGRSVGGSGIVGGGCISGGNGGTGINILTGAITTGGTGFAGGGGGGGGGIAGNGFSAVAALNSSGGAGGLGGGGGGGGVGPTNSGGGNGGNGILYLFY